MIAASCTGSCRPVAEDSHVPPLPRRAPDDRRPVPGGKPGGGSGLGQPLVLPESLQQRILTALDCGEDEAPPPERDVSHEAEASREAEAPAGRSASLPRRVPGANNGPEPPAQIAPPALLSSRVPPPPADAANATLGAMAAEARPPSPPPRRRPLPRPRSPPGPVPPSPCQPSHRRCRPSGPPRSSNRTGTMAGA